jgi:hypothetical protein
MFPRGTLLAACALLYCICVNALSAADPPSPTPDVARLPVALPALPVGELLAQLKDSLVQALPNELVFTPSDNWGHQVSLPSLQGVKLIHVPRNHGEWKKARVVTHNFPSHLSVLLSDLQSPDNQRIAFTLHLEIPAKVELDKQIWQDGLRIYASHVRARCQLDAVLTMEAIIAPLTPEATQRVASFQVTRAACDCSDFVVENINGLGGEFARRTGSQRLFQAWQPTVLREFQNAVLNAVQTASGTSDVRASLSPLLVRALSTRSALLKAPSPAPSWPWLDQPLPVAAPAPCAGEATPLPALFLFGGMTIPTFMRTEPSHVSGLDLTIRPGYVEHSQHVILPTNPIPHASTVHQEHVIPIRTDRYVEPEHKNP